MLRPFPVVGFVACSLVCIVGCGGSAQSAETASDAQSASLTEADLNAIAAWAAAAIIDMRRVFQNKVHRGECGRASDNYGLTKEDPLQIGASTGKSLVFFGGLVCADGSDAVTEQQADESPGPYERPQQVANETLTTFPILSVPAKDGRTFEELPLERYEVNCGTERTVIYVDPYVRGAFCAPKGFKVSFESSKRALRKARAADGDS